MVNLPPPPSPRPPPPTPPTPPAAAPDGDDEGGAAPVADGSSTGSSSSGDSEVLALWAIIVIAAGGGCLLLVSVAAVLARRKRRAVMLDAPATFNPTYSAASLKVGEPRKLARVPAVHLLPPMQERSEHHRRACCAGVGGCQQAHRHLLGCQHAAVGCKLAYHNNPTPMVELCLPSLTRLSPSLALGPVNPRFISSGHAVSSCLPSLWHAAVRGHRPPHSCVPPFHGEPCGGQHCTSLNEVTGAK